MPRALAAAGTATVVVVILAAGLALISGHTVGSLPGDLVTPFTLVFVPWGVVAGWAAFSSRRSIAGRAAWISVALSAVGVLVLAYHVDSPPSVLCAVEWIGVPGWPLGWLAVLAAHGLGAPEAARLWILTASLLSSPLLVCAALTLAGARSRVVRTYVLRL